jgi:hypothetical protein
MATQYRFNDDRPLSAAELRIRNGELFKFGENPEVPISDETPELIVRRELTSQNFQIEHIFDLGHADRKSLNGVDNGESATIYAEYIEGDAIYVMEYVFFLESNSKTWTHDEPTFWRGAALGVAAHVAKEYCEETADIQYDEAIVSWAGLSDDELHKYAPNYRGKSYSFAGFYIGRGDSPRHLIILASPDGNSHWEVIGIDEVALER